MRFCRRNTTTYELHRDESLLTVSLYRKEDNRLNAVCIARLVAIEPADTLTRQPGTKANYI